MHTGEDKPLLRVENINVCYGDVQVIYGVTLEAAEREIIAILGPNGAGKSSLLNAIGGIIPPKSGRVLVHGNAFPQVDSWYAVRRGMVVVPEGRQLFGPLTVRENLELGAYHKFKQTNRRDLENELKSVISLFPGLGERLNQEAATLSGGEQQMLAIARALMGTPEVLLLDEPTQGLAPYVVREIFRSIRQECMKSGIAVAIAEQNTRIALATANRAYVLSAGRISFEGNAEDLLKDEALLYSKYFKITHQELQKRNTSLQQ